METWSWWGTMAKPSGPTSPGRGPASSCTWRCRWAGGGVDPCGPGRSARPTGGTDRQRLHVQVLYAVNLQELLESWSLHGLQLFAAAGHRLRFVAGLMASVEAAMLKQVDAVGPSELAQLLVWAHAVSFEQLQARLVPLTAKRGTLASIEQAFEQQQPLLGIVRALRLELDSK